LRIRVLGIRFIGQPGIRSQEKIINYNLYPYGGVMKRLIIFIMAILFTIVSLTFATVINVPMDYPTIQQGIDVGNPGDTVLVAPGTYYENVQMAEGINLIGSGMHNTIIDGGGITDVITALQIDYFLIEKLTIQNSNQGGSSPGNVGVFINPMSSSGTKTVRYCSVRDNGRGIDIWNDFGGTAYIENNIIENNIYDGFDPYLGTVYLTNNIIVNNGWDGYSDWSGGGVVYIKNNIIAENGRYGIFKHRDTPVFISYNDVWNNVEGDYYEGYSGDPTPFNPEPGTGEISQFPLFRNPSGDDYHLMALACGDTIDSPCIDMGDLSITDGILNCFWGLGDIRSDMGVYGGVDSTATDIEDEILPMELDMLTNYPNPFNARTTIRYSLAEPSDAWIEIYDILGRRIKTIVESNKPAGEHRLTWNAEDHPSGVYFYRIQAGDYTETKKMVLLR